MNTVMLVLHGSVAQSPLAQKLEKSIVQLFLDIQFLIDEGKATMGIRNVVERMIVAREKQARRYVNGALLCMDDTTLKNAGYKREKLENQGGCAYPF